MQYPIQSHSLETILSFTQEKMQQLLKLLKHETLLLEKNNIQELKSITNKKTLLTEQIEKNEQQRIHFLNQKSLNPNKPKQWLQTNKLISLWARIRNISEQAQKQNQINGLVINGRRRRIQTQIEIFSTSAPAIELTYSASGENINQRDSRTLAHV